MIKLKPDDRLRVILNQIVPAIVDNLEGEFQKVQLGIQERNAYQLNELCEIPVADLPQYFSNIRQKIERQTKDVKRIPVATTPNQTW